MQWEQTRCPVEAGLRVCSLLLETQDAWVCLLNFSLLEFIEDEEIIEYDFHSVDSVLHMQVWG